jgi:hypothetical protein
VGVHFLCTLQYANAQGKKDEFVLNNASGVTIEGAHRFVSIAGITGLQSTSLHTKASVETTILRADEGSLSMWMSPMEDIDKAYDIPGSLIYPLISDTYPAANVDSSHFSVYYNGSGYPRLIARFTDGSFWGQMDYGVSPFVYAEALPLVKGQWYHVVVSWNKKEQWLKMYVNGEMVGHNYSAKSFKDAGNKLYIGNPLMVIGNVIVREGSITDGAIKKEYAAIRPSGNQAADSTIQAVVFPADKGNTPPLDGSWKKMYSCAFNKSSDLKEWTFQTGDKYRDEFTLSVSEKGLIWKTPSIIHTESRGYLWCPYQVVGDQCIEYEFQLLSPKGLALVIMCASGTQGEDIISDQGLRKTGSMSDMNANYRNYHWEYVRRVEAMRTDVETQYVSKNPWAKSLYVGCTKRLEQNRWIKMRFMKTGNRISGYLDGKKIFDTVDSAFTNNGPVYNSGRVVLRQMYATSMMYRNFVIYQR